MVSLRGFTRSALLDRSRGANIARRLADWGNGGGTDHLARGRGSERSRQIVGAGGANSRKLAVKPGTGGGRAGGATVGTGRALWSRQKTGGTRLGRCQTATADCRVPWRRERTLCAVDRSGERFADRRRLYSGDAPQCVHLRTAVWNILVRRRCAGTAVKQVVLTVRMEGKEGRPGGSSFVYYRALRYEGTASSAYSR